MSKPIHLHNARFGHFRISCECGNSILFSLVKGSNKRSTVCINCQGYVRIIAVYDGYGVATLTKLTVEKINEC